MRVDAGTVFEENLMAKWKTKVEIKLRRKSFGKNVGNETGKEIR